MGAADECQRIAPASSWPAVLTIPASWEDIVLGFARGVNDSGLAIHVTQVREKFGGLTILYDVQPYGGSHPRIEALIEIAEDAAAATCEECGMRGEIRNVGNWLRVLCIPCKSKFRPAPRARHPHPEDL